MAVGFLRCDWASAYLLNEITVLLVQEAVGFHAETHPIVGRFGASPFFALAGCENFDDPQNRRCGEKEAGRIETMGPMVFLYVLCWSRTRKFDVYIPED